MKGVLEDAVHLTATARNSVEYRQRSCSRRQRRKPRRPSSSRGLQRDPRPHNGFAKELFASDLLAVKNGRLSHPFEEDEKMLLRVGENFGLRGPEIDKLNLAALDKEREKAVKDAADDLKKMTMTVVDGDFPREVVGAQNLIFGEYRMPARRNTSEFYDAKDKKPAGKREGTLKLGALESVGRRGGGIRLGFIMFGAAIGAATVAATLRRRAGSSVS